MNPRFPVYIVSKGRWESRMTARAFDELRVPYYIVVEEQERAAYCKVIKGEVLTLDPAFQIAYDTCDARGVGKGRGSGPARNFAWEHSIRQGAEWHWVVDDNIQRFYRWHRNAKVPVADGTMFYAMEDFCLRYRNIAMAGPNYESFAPRRGIRPPLTFNTRIYSCNLIRNDVPFRWRGRYNEDTDLSLRMLKARWCTVLFNAFLQNKIRTLHMKGGNTDTIYVGGTLPKSQMLVALHPDVTKLVTRYGRWHHQVDYRPFRHNRPVLRDGVSVDDRINEFGMRLTNLKEMEHERAKAEADRTGEAARQDRASAHERRRAAGSRLA